ncbi:MULTISPECIES: hypothetical protein [unclassified Photobacterium]|uniref:hypothetical protein n=1 Tax=unclassified Photobacterium TaxID=2628852 RepID=UPI000D17CD8D|nr:MULTISPECIES: hypothetical protein [unclassified Photobacterium]PSV26980.1 hypothetical protein C9J42_08920 [Photobacterium sp. GB-56]PSV37384.1 hypothetical protein C9J38_11500 [Photobacterium sp. GB-210]PSV54208.1 hypothetical protein C9J45_05445 [Photobacterium sp. GB-1]PSV56615.1 hypothetical protein C9J43_11050 [Photobacterium sp. GB-3]
MSKIILSSIFLMITLTGCQTLSISLPESEYQGNLPPQIKNEIAKSVNDTEIEGMRGATAKVYFDSEKSLMTIAYMLRNPHWQWTIYKSDVEKDSFPYLCEKYGYEIHNGLGIRYWFSGSGGFTTDTVTKEVCNSLSS